MDRFLTQSVVVAIAINVVLSLGGSDQLSAQESFFFSSSFEQELQKLQNEQEPTKGQFIDGTNSHIAPIEVPSIDSLESPQQLPVAQNPILEMQSLQRLNQKSVAQRLDITPKIRAPQPKQSNQNVVLPQLLKTPKQVLWKSDQFCHGKLLFEEPDLERNGLECGEKKQVFKSAAKFFARGFVHPAAVLIGKGRGCESTDCYPRK